jgi:hypothetical protein
MPWLAGVTRFCRLHLCGLNIDTPQCNLRLFFLDKRSLHRAITLCFQPCPFSSQICVFSFSGTCLEIPSSALMCVILHSVYPDFLHTVSAAAQVHHRRSGNTVFAAAFPAFQLVPYLLSFACALICWSQLFAHALQLAAHAEGVHFDSDALFSV